ncbi:MAG: DrmB family protein [Pseudonocardiaceae bacterium]
MLGASNLWFSVTASALHLPQGQNVRDLVAAHWSVLGAQPSAEVTQHIVEGMDALRGVPIGEVWRTIEGLRANGGPQAEACDDNLLDAEWRLLSRPTTDRQDADFRAVPTDDVPVGFENLLDQIVLVSRLREVQALVGFTRLNAPERRDLEPLNRVPLTRGQPDWVPAVERRGEGIFLEFRQDAVTAWATAVDQHPRLVALRDAHGRWASRRGGRADPLFPVARMLLLHTLSHLLIRQVSLECGYSSASLRERLYLGQPGARTAGVLLSTAASDSEGTLGGLVALGETRYLTRLLELAFDDAQRCSSDPLCAEHIPQDPSETLHVAACHACLFVSETSCETNNRWLDRAVLVDLTGDGLAFPR